MLHSFIGVSDSDGGYCDGVCMSKDASVDVALAIAVLGIKMEGECEAKSASDFPSIINQVARSCDVLPCARTMHKNYAPRGNFYIAT
jgi:hypothetical protein